MLRIAKTSQFLKDVPKAIVITFEVLPFSYSLEMPSN